MQKDDILQTFVKFLMALNHRIQQSSQLYSGIILAQFLCTIQNVKLTHQQIIKDESIHGAALSNLKLISSQIQRYNRMELNKQQYSLDCEINLIYTESSVKQLAKLIKQCFIIAAKAPNSSYFIQKVLTLSQNQQVVFVNLIKEDRELMPSPSTEKESKKQQNLQLKLERTQHSNQMQTLELFDRIYDMQLQNQKYVLQIKRLHNQNTNAHQTINQLTNQIQNLNQYNYNLKKQLKQTIQSLHKLGIIKLKSTENMNRNQQCHQELEILSIKYKQEMELIKLKNQSANRRFELRIEQLENQLRIQSQNVYRLKQQNQFYQRQMENMLQKCTQYEHEVSEANRVIIEYKKITNELRQSQAAFKLQINYKNLQIKQLKSMIELNNSNKNLDNSVYHMIRQSEGYERQNGLNKSMRSSKMLMSQISNSNTSSTPNLRGSCILKVEADELRYLRNQIKQLQRQKQKYQQTKKRVRQLEYQKNKLFKVLQEYEVSRGQENDIITGCLYQLHNKLITNDVKNSAKTNSCIVKVCHSTQTLLTDQASY